MINKLRDVHSEMGRTDWLEMGRGTTVILPLSKGHNLVFLQEIKT